MGDIPLLFSARDEPAAASRHDSRAWDSGLREESPHGVDDWWRASPEDFEFLLPTVSSFMPALPGETVSEIQPSLMPLHFLPAVYIFLKLIRVRILPCVTETVLLKTVQVARCPWKQALQILSFPYHREVIWGSEGLENLNNLPESFTASKPRCQDLNTGLTAKSVIFL